MLKKLVKGVYKVFKKEQTPRDVETDNQLGFGDDLIPFMLLVVKLNSV